MDTSLLVSGIAIVKKELDHLDHAIRDTQISCSNTTKAINQARLDGDQLDQDIVKALHVLVDNQARYCDLKSALDRCMGRWRASVGEEDRLKGQIRGLRAAVMSQATELERQAWLFRQDMGAEADMRWVGVHGDLIASATALM